MNFSFVFTGENKDSDAHKSAISKRQNVPWYAKRKPAPSRMIFPVRNPTRRFYNPVRLPVQNPMRRFYSPIRLPVRNPVRQFYNPVRVPVQNPTQRFYRPSPYVAGRRPVFMPVARGNIFYRRPSVLYPPFRYTPLPFPQWIQRRKTIRYNPALQSRGWTVSGKMLNANTGTNSHTVSNSVLKQPGHTTTNTHVINKQHTGGGIRRMLPVTPIRYYYRYPYPYAGLNRLYARGRASASARVNAKASSGSSSSSKSQSSSSSNGGARTTAAGGGWGAGAGAGYGTGPGAWGIGYGGGAGGSAGSIPSGMKGIPGMASGYPGIPSGFPGMPAGGFPGQGSGHFAGAKGAKTKPSSTKGKQTAVKPKKGMDATLKAAKANKIKQVKYDKAKYKSGRLNAHPIVNKNQKSRTTKLSSRTMIPSIFRQPVRLPTLYRVL